MATSEGVNWSEKPTPDTIQMAHDILVAVILTETPLKPTRSEAQSYQLCASVLCWILGHTHNDGFSDLMQHVCRSVAEHGGRFASASEMPPEGFDPYTVIY